MFARSTLPPALLSIEDVGTVIPQSRDFARAPLAGVGDWGELVFRREITGSVTVPAGVLSGIPVFGIREEEGTPLSVTRPCGAWLSGLNCAWARTVVPAASD